MKQTLLSLLIALLPLVAQAETVEIDGIYYNLVKKVKTAEVTSRPSGKYTGVIEIPDSVEYEGETYEVTIISPYAFSGCIGLTNVTIHSSVTSIGGYAFMDCNKLMSVIIPNSVASIGGGAFSGCSGLKEVHITDLGKWCQIRFENGGANPLSYAHHLYVNGKEIKDLVIPSSITSIGESAFLCCSGLTSATIPNSVTSIGERAFGGCSGLTSITIPNSVTNIGSYAFQDCSGITSITIPNSLTYLNYCVFKDCIGLTNITFGSSLKTIGNVAFENCSSLMRVILPNTLNEVGRSAFSGCTKLTSIYIPSSVTKIEDSSFANCPELTDVYCEIKTPLFSHHPQIYNQYYDNYIKTNAFDNSLIEYATLHVPAEACDSYKDKAPWSSFGTIVAIDGDVPGIDTPENPKCATPTIAYKNGKLTFSCATEGVEYVSEVTVADAKKYYTGEVNLGTTYKVSVVAMKTGYENSDAATMEINVGGSDGGPLGDLNGDGKVDATDITRLVNIVLKR